MTQTNVTIQAFDPITVQAEPLVLSTLAPALQKPYTSFISGNGKHPSSRFQPRTPCEATDLTN